MGVVGARMVSDDNTRTLDLLLCVTGLLNASNESSADYSGGHGAAWNGTQEVGSDDSSTWLRDVIKTRLVPTVCVFGIVGNVLTLVVLAYERLRTGAAAERTVNVWLQALAVSDLLLCVVLLPHGLMTYGGRLIHMSLSFQLLYQSYGAALINNFMLTSTWLTVAMSFGRYMAVCHPLSVYHRIIPVLADCAARGGSRRTRVKAGVIFVVCFLFNLPRFFEYRVESHSCDGVGPGASRLTVFALSPGGAAAGGWLLGMTYVWVYLVVAIVVPLMLLAFCNVRLVNALRRSRQFRSVAQHHSVVVGDQHTAGVGTGVTMITGDDYRCDDDADCRRLDARRPRRTWRDSHLHQPTSPVQV